MKRLAVVAMLILAACNTTQEPAPADSSDILSHPLGMGAGFYELYCVQCHGTQGLGVTGITTDLPTPPPDLSQLTARNGGLFPVRRVMGQIYGYAGKYRPDPFHRGLVMEFGPLLEGALVEWIAPDGSIEITPRGMLDLLLYLESFQIDALGPR